MTASAIPDERLSLNSRLAWSGYVSGIALSGFFDGILLHQVLQWHHLLANLGDAPFDDLRVQVLADGVFHALMYVVAALGLVLLVRSRRELALPGAERLLIATGLIGFGAWNVADAIIFHWVLGIHHIRMDSDMPLVWDLIWFVAFGLVPLVIGWTLRPAGGTSPRHGGIAASFLALALMTAAPLAALPPPDAAGAVVLFKRGVSPAEAMAAIESVGGRLAWTDPSGALWAIEMDEPARARQLYRRGALLVSNTLLPAGCLSWSRPSAIAERGNRPSADSAPA
jgi:uncharacterized membrane protein